MGNIKWIITDTNQNNFYDLKGNQIKEVPLKLKGQDAEYKGVKPDFTDNLDGTITDNNTGLVWMKNPNSKPLNYDGAKKYIDQLNLNSDSKWRLPTVKELFGISDFSKGWPYLDTEYFNFAKISQESRPIGHHHGPGGPMGGMPPGRPPFPPPHRGRPGPRPGSDFEDEVGKFNGQFWSSNKYLVGNTHGDMETAFGVNHASGHVKGYPCNSSGPMGKYVRAVMGEEVTNNDFFDNHNQTITDSATGLMWAKRDNELPITWKDALKFVRECNSSHYLGYKDWRLPNVKELQSIVDYSGLYPAINKEFFRCTENKKNPNFYYWSSTSAYFSKHNPKYTFAWYVAFGYAVDKSGNDIHGAGAVRFAAKKRSNKRFSEGNDNIYNYVRLVRSV
ncbi:MAG: DUF1566 domain-containing protein [Sphaerochaetaceae bacterium]|nr:DUF1566 domain-containing protein [Sphaerochaetaceae bacterium]